jgi:transcriptional regulator
VKTARQTKTKQAIIPTEQPTEHTKALTAPKGIDIEDILAYKKKGLSHSEIGKMVGCSEQNVSNRIQSLELESLENFRNHKDSVMESIQRSALKNIGDAELKSMNPLQRITAAAILQDKIQVIRGQATEIIDHRVMVVDLNRVCDQLRAEQGMDAITVEQSVDIVVDKCPNG